LCFGDGASRKHTNKKQAGFTLVEVIVVIVIIAILAAIGVPALTGYIDKAQDKQYITKARDLAIATHAVLDEAYADGEFSDPKGDPDPSFADAFENGDPGFTSEFRIWSIHRLSVFTSYSPDRYYHRIFDLLGENYHQFQLNSGQVFYPVGSSNSTIFNADGFVWMFSPEEMDPMFGSKNVSFIVVTYKLTRASHLDSLKEEDPDEYADKIEPSEILYSITSETTYDPDAGYEVYHGFYRGI
jgi:prepilin-type N-terminal cleavage/methylation domain-containing protein